MIENYKVAYIGCEAEIIEKKSRFIGMVFPITSEEEAVTIIEQLRKKYWNATHNCYAYVCGKQNELQRFSDDGEPSGTAGKPILDVLLGEEIHNALIVVTRYFGGTLLGTGGLVRAYSKAAKEAVMQSVIITKIQSKQMQIITDYNAVGKIQYILAQMEIDTIDTQYTEQVEFNLVVPNDMVHALSKKITEATSATAVLEEVKDVYYAKVNGEILLFDQ